MMDCWTGQGMLSEEMNLLLVIEKVMMLVGLMMKLNMSLLRLLRSCW